MPRGEERVGSRHRLSTPNPRTNWPAFSTKSAVISTLSTALVPRRDVLTSRPFWGWGVSANVWSSGIGIAGARWLRRARSAR